MPLDATGEVLLGHNSAMYDPLERMGIVPIDAAFVGQYKAEYRAEIILTKLRRQHRVSRGIEWLTATAEMFHSVRHFLYSGLDCYMASDRSAAPPELVALAERVEKGILGAEFSIDYLYIDPVLNVTYPVGDGKRTVCCLGIWDKGVLKKIAQS